MYSRIRLTQWSSIKCGVGKKNCNASSSRPPLARDDSEIRHRYIIIRNGGVGIRLQCRYNISISIFYSLLPPPHPVKISLSETVRTRTGYVIQYNNILYSNDVLHAYHTYIIIYTELSYEYATRVRDPQER